ncbi:MAG: T9SS type A sorting domain-containing protein, partial [Flavobacteriales bacterium]
IKVSHTDPNIVYAAGIYTYRSTNGGNTWQYWDYSPQENPPYTHPDVHQIAIDPLLSNRIYAFTDGGIYRTDNGGGTWYLKNNNLVTMQFYYAVSAETNENVAMGGTQDNGIWVNHHLDTSSTWFQYTYGDGFACAIDQTNENTMYGAELFQSRMRSTDGGYTYVTIDNGLTESNVFVIPLVIHPTNPAILFTATNTKIYKSIDSGFTWVPMVNISYIITFAFDKTNPDIMYAANDPAFSVSRLYRSLDGGITWAQVTVPGNKLSDIETDPFQTGVLYVTRARFTPGYQVWKSPDMGDNWINITGDLPAIPANCFVADPFTPNYFYVGTDLGAFMTSDGGTTWNSFNQGLPFTVVQDMHFQKSDTTLRTGTHGRGFWTTKLAHHVPAVIPGVGCVTEFHIAPNPVSSNAVISFSNEEGCDVRITVVNQLGQQVAEIYNGKPISGIQQITWSKNNQNGSNVAPGIYYFVVTTNGNATVHKVVVGE